MKSLLNNILGKKKLVEAEPVPVVKESDDAGEGGVQHLWITQNDAPEPSAKKAEPREPKVDTAIMRNRIAEKIAKLNNH